MEPKSTGGQEALEKAFTFRSVRREEIDEVARIESICFPPNEACTRQRMYERILVAEDYFLVAYDASQGRIAGFLNGVASNGEEFRDEFFTDATTHEPGGRCVMLLGLDVLPEYRRRGLARTLVSCYAKRERERGTKRLVLTCLEDKVEMYLKFGFRDLGLSASEWGGEAWHEMDLLLGGT